MSAVMAAPGARVADDPQAATIGADAALPASEGVNITEGQATIQFASAKDVFYNPVQVFNRDLSVAGLQTFCNLFAREKRKQQAKRRSKADSADEGDEATALAAGAGSESVAPHITVLEALSASGLRALRYWKEVRGLTHIVANDLSEAAVATIRRNIALNGVAEADVEAHHGDATLYMHELRSKSKRFTVVDLDPYGSAAPFLDAAVQAVEEGGLLMVTCTDMAVLSGNHHDACWAKYGVMPIHAKYCHEMALRILLSSIDQHASRYRRYIVPLLSLSIDFYVRVFVRVYTSPSEVKRSASKRSYLYQCSGCPSFSWQQVGKRFEEGNRRRYTPGLGPTIERFCPHCGRGHQMGGPFWTEPIHDAAFVASMLELIKASPHFATHERMLGTISMVAEELHDVPLYYVIPALCGAIHCTSAPHATIRSALLNQGYRVSCSHANSDALKTDAPADVLWDIIRCWERRNPVVRANIKPNSPAAAILAKAVTTEANFDVHPDAVPPSRKFRLVRFPDKPDNWGPMARARIGTGGPSDSGSDAGPADAKQQMIKRRRENQGKSAKRAAAAATVTATAAAEDESAGERAASAESSDGMDE